MCLGRPYDSSPDTADLFFSVTPNSCCARCHMKPLDTPLLLEIYRKMVAVRTFEETAADLFLKGQLPGFLHCYIGEEAVAAGVCAHLTPQDMITSTHRGHGHAVAKGARLDMMMAELF